MDTQLSVHRSVSSRLYGDSDRLSFHPDLHDSCTQLPSEVLEIIITEFWHSENTLFISRSILEGCIRLCHFSRHLLSNSSLSSVSPLHCSLQTFSNLLPFSPRIYPYHDLLCRSHGISQGRRHCIHIQSSAACPIISDFALILVCTHIVAKLPELEFPSGSIKRRQPRVSYQWIGAWPSMMLHILTKRMTTVFATHGNHFMDITHNVVKRPF